MDPLSLSLFLCLQRLDIYICVAPYNPRIGERKESSFCVRACVLIIGSAIKIEIPLLGSFVVGQRSS